jgi:Protein of unknown function (DUF4233)
LRILCASTLIAEAVVIGFAALVAMRLSDLSTGTVWLVSGIAMGVCVLLCGALSLPGAVAAGWVVQVGLVASGFVVPMMFGLGAVFAGLWWAAVHFGRKIDVLKAEHAAAEAAAEAAAGV